MNVRYALPFAICAIAGCTSIPEISSPTDAENEKTRSALNERRHARADSERAAADVGRLESELESVEEAMQRRRRVNEGPRQRHAEQTREYNRYVEAIETAMEIGAQCKSGSIESAERVPTVYGVLKAYVSEEKRDSAVAALEFCRKRIARAFEKSVRRNVVEERRDFAEGVEDRFDENNPWSKGKLIALVKGNQLHVRMRGNFEGRRRHSQSQLDTWCETSGSEYFSKITLRNSHGQFSCTPTVSLDDMIDQELAVAELDQDWRVVGERPTPEKPQPLPPPPLSDPSKKLAEQKTAAEALLAASKEQLKTARARERAAERSVVQTNSSVETRIYNDVQDATNQAKGLKLGGLTVGGLGALAIVGGSTLAVGDDPGNRPTGFALIGVGATAATVGLIVALVGISRLNSLEAIDVGRVALTYPSVVGSRSGGAVSFGMRF